MTADVSARAGELLIRGALLADGTGTPLAPRDVVVAGGRVTAVTRPGEVPADGGIEVLDATGQVLAPGFIDVHSHADNAALLDEDDTTKILQGVTTEVPGNCGFSLAPVVAGREQELSALAERLFPSLEWGWKGMADFFAVADARGHVTNQVPLVGHGVLRIGALGFEDRPADAGERAVMAGLLDEALEAGVFGMSTGLIYPPGVFGDTEELTELVARLPEGRVYATHMRGEGATLNDSIEESLAIVRGSAARLQISHLKSAGKANWGLVNGALERIVAAREAGVPVTQDMYPYTASSTMLTTRLPNHFQDGGDEAVMRRLADPAAVRALRSEIEAGLGDGESILIASTVSHDFEGRTLGEIAAAAGTTPFDAMLEILTAERLRVSMVAFSMCEDDVRTVLRDPRTMIGSDGLPPGVGGRPHPRLFGTFPRILGRYVREFATIDLATAVHRMTGLPAEVFGLRDRGEVRPGAIADLVAFDQATVSDVGDYRDPVHPPVGFGWVMQGGEVVVRDGRWLAVRRGQRLLPG